MSGQLESALVIELVNAIRWDAALLPTAADGTLTVVDPAKSLDITKYSRRDRELAYRDLVNATAVVKVSLHVETVWNTTATRPKLQGITGDDLPPVTGDLGAVNSTVVHVKNSSLPLDALATDKDLAGRDALVYEVLARACEIFDSPPITTSGANAPGTSAWSLGEGVDYNVQPSPSMPLNKNAFYMSDVSLAERDNQIAAYAAKLADVLKNPFAFADRLYVQVDGVDARDAEVYSLVRVYFQTGQVYVTGDQVFYQTSWYEALTTTSEVPIASSGWVQIAAPRLRIWTAEPALPFRNRVIYDTVAKTLQWFREVSNVVHPPQLFALSIPGMFAGQTINTLAKVPERKDAQYWRQKAARIDVSGTEAVLLSEYQDTTQILSGYHMTDTIGLTVPSALSFNVGVPVQTGHKYRLSALVRPVQKFTTYGNRNLLGISGTDEGVTFSGAYAPTTTEPGSPVPYSIQLPPGTWYLTIDYTNVSGTTPGFGLKILLDDATVADDTVPLLFQDSSANPLDNGTSVTSQEWRFTSIGVSNLLKFIWTYGDGSFQINSLTFRTSDRIEGEYFIRAEAFDSYGTNAIYDGLVPTIEATGRRNFYEVLNWDFSGAQSDLDPTMTITWMTTSELPIQFRKFSLSELVPVFGTPGIAGFDSFKWECMKRAERSVQAAFNEQTSTTTGTLSDFTTDGTLWKDASSEGWIGMIESSEPRLRQLFDVTFIREGYQYEVTSGYIVYDGGTYSPGDVFNGTNVSAFLSYDSSEVDQVGAFRKSVPADLGQPVLMPLGLRYDDASGGIIRMDNAPIDQLPVVVAGQAWMIEAGVYAANEDFRAGDIAN